MAKVVTLALSSEQQQSFMFCGPAAIRMILSAFGVTVSQNSLWAEVQSHSAGGTLVPKDGSLSLLFPKQVCTKCGTAWYCWYTTPEAMASTIAANAPYGQSAGVVYPDTGNKALQALLTSLDRPVRFPPAATIRGANHWVVMNGYHIEDPAYPGAPPVTIGHWSLNGVFYLNPFEGPTPVVTFATTAAWKTMLKSIDCGIHTDDYPLVVGRKPSLLFKWWNYIFLIIRRWPWPPWRTNRDGLPGRPS